MASQPVPRLACLWSRPLRVTQGPGGEAHATSGPCRVSVGWHRRGVEAALGRGCVSPGRASEEDSLAQEDMPPSEFRGLRVASQP